MIPLALTAFVLSCTASATFVVAGQVVDASSGAALADVLVQLTPAVEGAGASAPDPQLTSADGRFRFSGVAAGVYVLSASTVGYAFATRVIDVGPSVAGLLITLSEGAGGYRETVTVVGGESAPADAAPAASSSLGSAQLLDLRGVTTDDPMRAVQALPGAATGDDFQAGFSVRGSAFRHLGVVVDGVPAPRLLHAVQAVGNEGSVAMINTDVLAGATLTAGPHPRRAGEWLGPTLEFETREGSRDRTGLRAAVSGTSASFVAEGPVGGAGRGSWLVSARKSYLDWLVRQLEPEIDSTIGFADALAKVALDVTRRDTVELLVIGGDAVYREHDLSGANATARATSGSTLATLSWRRADPGLVTTVRATFFGSEFRNTGPRRQEIARGYRQSVRLQASAVRPIGERWVFAGGAAWQRDRANEILRRYRFAAAGLVPFGTRDVSPRVSLAAVWAQASRGSDASAVTAGVRVTGGSAVDRVIVQPWLLAERRLGPLRLHAAAGRTMQPVDPLSFPGPDAGLRAETAVDAEAGVAGRLAGRLDWRVSAFHRRDTDGLRPLAEDRIDPASGDRLPVTLFPEFASTLDGRTRGLDLVVRRMDGDVTGWIGYTWSKTSMRDIETGERFDGDVDQRHTLNAVAAWRLSHRTTVGAKLRVGSNVPVPGYYEGARDDVRLGASRNRLRLPTYARLDLRVTRAFVWPRRRLTLFAEIMNVLARENLGYKPPLVRPDLMVARYTERLIPFVPSAGLLVEF